jgi:hypothetical protein
MSRPQKIIPPVKGDFQKIINSVADGKGVKQIRNSLSKPAANPPAPKKAMSQNAKDFLLAVVITVFFITAIVAVIVFLQHYMDHG